MPLTDRDRTKLAGCHPHLVAQLDVVFDAIAALGWSLTVTDGVRTKEQQQALYAKGRTTAGPVVTHADGVTTLSNHQVHADGFGHAADCAFLIKGQPSWDARLPWKAYGACAEALGLHWGGDWTTLHDLPHVELPA